MITRVLATALLAAFAMSQTGCIGSMALSSEVRKMNMNFDPEPWPREALFFILYVIPVYPFAGAIDLLVVNSVEFWTGTNPVSNASAAVTVAQAGDVHQEVAPDGTTVLSTLRSDGSIDIEVTAPDGTQTFFNLKPERDRLVARDGDGLEYVSVDRDLR